MNWATIVAAVTGALAGSAGIAPIILALARRGPIRAGGEISLSEESRQWVNEFQEDARAARSEAAGARNDAAAVRTELHIIRREAEQVSRYLLRVLTWIDTPGMDMVRLRRLVTTSTPPISVPPSMDGGGSEEQTR